MTTRKKTFNAGQELLGFRITDVTTIESMRAIAIQAEHVKSGAKLIHLACDDNENCFSINFPTPPPDDTGMPHILEHMVLAGSKQFPVKEPFFEMAKMSMATFINAMTGYDATYYPVCSNVPRDLFNLAEVYFDAVFHPLLTDQIFEREAHHLEPADPANPTAKLRRDGIVYSEMKGVFSDPESILMRLAVRSLMPDTCYGKESGGAPEYIPQLTNLQLKDFHSRWYHPGNSLFVLYGNIPTEDYLTFLAPRLVEYGQPAELTPRPSWQPRWEEPRFLSELYPISEGTSVDNATYLSMNWLFGDASEPCEAARLNVLSLLLLGHDAAPLKRALIDARIGANVTMSGIDAAGAEAIFHVSIEGSEAARLKEFRGLVLQTLEKLAATPFDKIDVEAAFQQATYASVEIQPLYPLHTVFKVVSGWLTCNDPLVFLETARYFSTIRAEWEKDPLVFNKLIAERLLANNHRLDIVLAPDAGLEQREEAKIENEMAALRAALKDDDVEKIVASAVALQQSNITPNTPEEVANLPQLKIGDLARQIRDLPSTVDSLSVDNKIVISDLVTNDIVYLQINFDLSGLPRHLWQILPMYVDAFSKFGAAEFDFAAIAKKRSAATGSLRASYYFTTSVNDPRKILPNLKITLKTTRHVLKSALDLTEDLLFDLNPCDRERMRDVLTQVRMDNRMSVIQDGSTTVRIHSARALNEISFLEDLTDGLLQLELSEKWHSKFDSGYDEVTDNVNAIRKFILNRNRVSASLTAPNATHNEIKQRLNAWLNKMSDAPVGTLDSGFAASASAPCFIGLAAPLQISHSAMSLPAPHRSHPDEPLLAIGAHLLSHDYLLPHIRFKGNAYGAGCRYQPLNGVLSLTAFRDPRIVETLQIFESVKDFVQNVPWTQADIDRGIIGVAKRDERPLRPEEATAIALLRFINGDNAELLSIRRQRLLQATPENVRSAMLRTLEQGIPHAATCVMSGRAQLQEANHKRDKDKELTICDIFND